MRTIISIFVALFLVSSAVAQDKTSSFGMVGIQFGDSGDPRCIARVWPDTPASRLGINAGDFILSIDGVDTEKLQPKDLFGAIHGPVGTPVTLAIRRKGDGKVERITLTRVSYAEYHAAHFNAEVEESRQRAYVAYPAMRDDRSELAQTVTALAKKARRELPSFFDNSDWPFQITKLCAENLKRNKDADEAKKDPQKVADTFVNGLKTAGSVKSAVYARTVRQAGKTLVIYAMDYITEGGFRREGPYVILLDKTPDGLYYVIDFYPWQT